ncbi:hypothetical protein Y032_0158g3237 [Ancylostoma ceylanicum]|uniref:Uncharacterized protein n=1 Tax=Ancylostoma ceylanicum TaxID=53326 RepID=A0A016SXX8_9BILA|nr:hypothetical protein Y032_0158g3237 [Ancylostoma ceylanicum]
MNLPFKVLFTVLLEKIDGFRDCRIASGPGRGMRKEHVQLREPTTIPAQRRGRAACFLRLQKKYFYRRSLSV